MLKQVLQILFLAISFFFIDLIAKIYMKYYAILIFSYFLVIYANVKNGILVNCL